MAEDSCRPQSSLKRRSELAIAIPASFVADLPHLREKTFRIGLVGRAAAIFRVNRIIVYLDAPSIDQREEARLIQAVLSYMETPQYLRRQLFRIIPELQYAGTLPPLRTPHHPTANRIADLKVGEYREGVVISRSKEGFLIDIGVEKPVLTHETSLDINARVTVKLTKLGTQLSAAIVNRSETPSYWGYEVSYRGIPMGQLLKKGDFDLVIATSRKGYAIGSVIDKIQARWNRAQMVLVAFGAPSQGLHEIAAHEHLSLNEITDFVVNTIPNQGAETVRTEEAVYATLSILNTLDER